MQITKYDRLTGLDITCEIPIEQKTYDDWMAASNASERNALIAHLNRSQREFLISGMGIKSQTQMFRNCEGLEEVIPEDLVILELTDSKGRKFFVVKNDSDITFYAQENGTYINVTTAIINDGFDSDEVSDIDAFSGSEPIKNILEFYYLIQDEI